ncbi:MAG: dienelactone hydrolase family protein [Mucilaginibacter polytrichastri]|nr:dienelactone hydrolase family protein [Mucilaginibacter polytrichastri]
MYTHNYQIFRAGEPLSGAEKAIILLHGRGSTAENMLRLGEEFSLVKTALIAPQATHRSWYPHSFLAEENQNQPALDSAIATISQTVEEVLEAGIVPENLFLLGFSQGACLTLEYAARNARKLGGLIAFTGGLIGNTLKTERYSGDFSGTPVLITTGDPDDHVPLSRVHESVGILQKSGAKTALHVYPGRPHTITQPEFGLAQQLFDGKFTPDQPPVAD